MTYEDRLRRIGWIAVLAVCAALYLGLHLKVHSVKSDLVRSERRIVQLEEQNLLLETEFLTRSSQLQLAKWNRVDFGYRPPEAGQFIAGERQLAALGIARPASRPGASADIQLASYSPDDAQAEQVQVEQVRFEQARRPVSPLTGDPLEPALLAVADETPRAAPRLAMVMPDKPTRVQLTALTEAAPR